MCWKEEFIDLCYCCSSDSANLFNMRNFVIPSLEREAKLYRECLAERRDEDTGEVWDGIEADLRHLEQAIASARQRCQREPQQQQLFAA